MNHLQKTNNMTLVVCGRDEIESGVTVKSNYVVISIRDPERRKARVRRQSGLKDVLYLAFHDAELSKATKLPDDIKPMTADRARQIWAFVRKWEKLVGTIVVHCEQGMSRSPAVAAALSRYFGGDEGYFFQNYQPNLLMRGLMVEHLDMDKPSK
jgi:predicted protein tyrosine phosphatase